MACKDIIVYDFKPLTTDQNVSSALEILDDYQLEQLPVVDENNVYQGIINYEILSNSHHQTIKELITHLPLLKAAVNDKAFPYRAAKIMVENKLDIIPVVDSADVLLGIINKDALFNFLVLNTGIMQSGGIVILEIKTFNYSLSEIARICETNDVLILNLQIKSIPDEDVMQIILKTNSKDLRPLEASFQRYEYHVSVIDGDLNTNSLVKERYDLLMNYLKL